MKTSIQSVKYKSRKGSFQVSYESAKSQPLTSNVTNWVISFDKGQLILIVFHPCWWATRVTHSYWYHRANCQKYRRNEQKMMFPNRKANVVPSVHRKPTYSKRQSSKSRANLISSVSRGVSTVATQSRNPQSSKTQTRISHPSTKPTMKSHRRK